MPKIVDHQAYRTELARRAATLFSQHGYSGLGMRRIASELGVSKSALYHYFPTKRDLFIACTAVVTQDLEEQTRQLESFNNDATDEVRIAALRGIFEGLAPSIAREISLLLDYLRDHEPDDIAADPSMEMANKRYRNLVVALVGERRADAVYALMLGGLMRQYLDGARTGFSDIEAGLRAILQELRES